MVLHEGLIRVRTPDMPPPTQVDTPSCFSSSIVEEFHPLFFLPSCGGFIHIRWVVDHALDFTSDDTSGMVDSYDRLLSGRLEWLVVVHPDGATQRHETPSLMNASQRDFSCRGGQIIAFPPRPGLHQLGCLLDLGATVDC
ncbi:hypothetical protein B296_00000306 [Ensete ventricosum]|uniref:Uncharacterized protein n=1 Tax=Ensete ventricosum TaxID=4639 RepID=A0A427AP45_ENSVE|nr:hypothetical protein B296_00000306 [Ensete ventricosum]